MARFLKLNAYSDDLETDHLKKVERWINVYNIDEIVAVSEYTTRMFLHFGDKSGHYDVSGGSAVWAGKIDALIAADIAGHHPHDDEEEEAEDDDTVTVRARGKWTKGEAYEQLDMVDHPTEEGKRYIAVAANTSTAVTILSNKAFWCQLKDVE